MKPSMAKVLRDASIEVAMMPTYLSARSLESFSDSEEAAKRLEAEAEKRRAVVRRRKTYKALGL